MEVDYSGVVYTKDEYEICLYGQLSHRLHKKNSELLGCMSANPDNNPEMAIQEVINEFPKGTRIDKVIMKKIPERWKVSPTTKSYVEVSLGLWNPLKIVAKKEDVINATNKICNFVGWNCFDAKCSVENITLYVEKTGSPALPIMAIIGAIAIIITGAVIISINWRMVRVEEEDTKQEMEKTKQIESNEDLFNAITDEYNKGLITDETYNEIVEQLGYSQLQLTKPKQEEPKKSIWGDMGEMLSGALPIILLIALIGAIKR